MVKVPNIIFITYVLLENLCIYQCKFIDQIRERKICLALRKWPWKMVGPYKKKKIKFTDLNANTKQIQFNSIWSPRAEKMSKKYWLTQHSLFGGFCPNFYFCSALGNRIELISFTRDIGNSAVNKLTVWYAIKQIFLTNFIFF